MSSFLEKFNEETIDETKGIVTHENEIEEDTSYLDKQIKKNIISFGYKHGIQDYLYDSFSLAYIRCF